MAFLDAETIARLKESSPRAAHEEVKAAVYRAGGSSEDFLDAFEELVKAGVLTWDDIEAFEAGR